MKVQKNATEEKVQRIKILEDLIIESIEEITGFDIIKLNLRDLDEAPTDSFIICSGSSSTQVKSIADNIQLRVKKGEGLLPSHVEGESSQRWILIDYFDIVVHVFYPEAREFYDLETLWSDAETVEYSSI